MAPATELPVLPQKYFTPSPRISLAALLANALAKDRKAIGQGKDHVHAALDDHVGDVLGDAPDHVNGIGGFPLPPIRSGLSANITALVP